MNTPTPIDRVAIVVPVLNEERYIEACLHALLQQAAGIDADVLVFDGGSTDATRQIVARLQASHPRLALHDNPGRLQSAAVNLAARIASPDVTVLVRADAHAGYPPDFVATCVTALRQHDATAVVVPMRTVGVGGMQRAIAAVQNSRLGNGGAAHRVGGKSGFVDHGHHAAFDRAFFQRIGGYDETFSHNEDAEHDERARRAGGRIWMCAEATIDYFPRTRLWPLARQYFKHGSGRAGTMLKHRMRPRPRQMAAPVILIGCIGGLLLEPLQPWLAAGPAGYLLGCLTWGSLAAARARDPWLLAIAPAAMTVHFSWGAGFLSTILAKVRARSGAYASDPARAS
ncbi:MAG: glycosyltransferase family 2 protein [Acetobacteraceae bacterium]|nr:glycosyltransferase family 2 protein [Acetobacteraceae bacterium]